jgi:hypothetical protein
MLVLKGTAQAMAGRTNPGRRDALGTAPAEHQLQLPPDACARLARPLRDLHFRGLTARDEHTLPVHAAAWNMWVPEFSRNLLKWESLLSIGPRHHSISHLFENGSKTS